MINTHLPTDQQLPVHPRLRDWLLAVDWSAPGALEHWAALVGAPNLDAADALATVVQAQGYTPAAHARARRAIFRAVARRSRVGGGAPGHLWDALVALAPPWHYRGWMGLLLGGAALARWDQGRPWCALGTRLSHAMRQELAALLDQILMPPGS